MKVAFVQCGLGGEIDHTMVDVPSDGTRWDSTPAPTVALYESSGGALLTSTAATQGPSLAISSTAAAAGTTVPVTSTTGLRRWDEVVLGPNASGEWEWKTVSSFTATSITTTEKLDSTYSTDHGCKSHTLRFIVSTTTCGSISRNCRAEWDYWVDGVERKESTIFHIGLYSPRIPLNAAEVLQEDPRAAKLIGSNQDIDLLLKRLWENYVLPAIGRVFNPGALVSGEAAQEALWAKLRHRLSLMAKDFDSAERYAEEYTSAVDMLRDSMIDLNEDGAQDDNEVPRSVRTPRIMRG